MIALVPYLLPDFPGRVKASLVDRVGLVLLHHFPPRSARADFGRDLFIEQASAALRTPVSVGGECGFLCGIVRSWLVADCCSHGAVQFTHTHTHPIHCEIATFTMKRLKTSNFNWLVTTFLFNQTGQNVHLLSSPGPLSSSCRCRTHKQGPSSYASCFPDWK